MVGCVMDIAERQTLIDRYALPELNSLLRKSNIAVKGAEMGLICC